MTITTGGPHGLKAGDTFVLHEPSRLARLKRALARPRVHYVTSVTATTMEVAERRMTWRKRRAELWGALRG